MIDTWPSGTKLKNKKLTNDASTLNQLQFPRWCSQNLACTGVDDAETDSYVLNPRGLEPIERAAFLSSLRGWGFKNDH